MERYYEQEEFSDEERLERFSRFLAGVVYLDDLFPPEGGVREPRRNPRNNGPRIGSIALIPLWGEENLVVPLPEEVYGQGGGPAEIRSALRLTA